ncbi:Gfo/Idh/MocA family protein [Halobellus sp. GM3]|uniref:Gfo/Idh/MocA family protein n=1 Tax=Halobellus sp. GM3 TaxID=3458410 RepID=UPI00403DE2A9
MTLRIGMLGYRFMGRAHANALARLPMFFPDAPDVERAVLIGRDEAALAAAVDTLGFDRGATDWRDALGEIDVLYNLGPNHLHPEPSIAALDRGVHVFCEKPLAHELDLAERMATAARDSDAVAAIGFNYRFVPAIALAKRLIAAGELGEIRQFRGRYLQDWLCDPAEPWSWRLDESLAGSGALGDLGAHTLDLARYLVGDVDAVSGHLRTFVEERPDPRGEGTRPVTVDDAFSAQLAFEGGAVGTVEASRVADGHANDHAIAVHGTEGSLRFSLERLNELAVKRRGGRGYERVLVTDESDPYVDHWWPPGHVLGWEHTFVHEDYEFLTAVASARRGESTRQSESVREAESAQRFRPDFRDGLVVQRTLDATERSHRDGEWIPLDAELPPSAN